MPEPISTCNFILCAFLVIVNFFAVDIGNVLAAAALALDNHSSFDDRVIPQEPVAINAAYTIKLGVLIGC